MKKRRKGRVKDFEQAKKTQPDRGQKPSEESINTAKKNIRINKTRIIMTVIVIILIAVVGMSVKTVFDLRAEQSELKKESKALLAEKSALTEELENVNDKEYIEEQARIQLKLIKPGEILYILEDEQDNQNDDEEEN